MSPSALGFVPPAVPRKRKVQSFRAQQHFAVSGSRARGRRSSSAQIRWVVINYNIQLAVSWKTERQRGRKEESSLAEYRLAANLESGHSIWGERVQQFVVMARRRDRKCVATSLIYNINAHSSHRQIFGYSTKAEIWIYIFSRRWWLLNWRLNCSSVRHRLNHRHILWQCRWDYRAHNGKSIDEASEWKAQTSWLWPQPKWAVLILGWWP